MRNYKPEKCLKSTISRDPWAVLFDRYGTRYEQYREKWCAASTTPIETNFPLHLDMDITDSCNMDCPLCHQKYRKRKENVMSQELLDGIFSEAAQHNLCAVNFGASAEPLLQQERLFYGMERASQSGVMEIFLHTNGLLLSQDVAERLVRSPVTCICISMDAFTPEVYAQCRGIDALNIISKNVLALVESRERAQAAFPIIRVSFCDTPLNHHEKELFVDKWKDIVDLVEVQSFRKVEGNIDTGQMVIDSRSRCSSPFKRAMIWPDGTMTLCCGFVEKDVVVGSLAEHSVQELWTSKMFQAVRKAFARGAKFPATCAKCMVSNYHQT